MKVTKPFCIDAELIEELKKTNASLLVNSLLKEHFDAETKPNLIKLKQIFSEKTQKKKILLKELRDLRLKIDKMEQEERKILKITKQFSDKELDLLKNCESRIRLSLLHRQTILKNRRWIDVKQVWQELKGGKSIK